MKQEYITTNIRLPKTWHKGLKRCAMERDESLGELIRRLVKPYAIVFEDIRRKDPKKGLDDLLGIIRKREAMNAPKKRNLPAKVSSLADLAKYAQAFGTDVSSHVDDIVYGESFN